MFFAPAGVLVSGNRIADCAYTAVRGNAASDIQIIANNCARLGEVALYAEFGFEGALIANNLVDTAATGISVTNFNDGGRLAVVQGNLVRNLFRREHEPVDKRGHGITVEADTAVNGNVIERAPTAGHRHRLGAVHARGRRQRNLMRNSRVGILVSSDTGAGACLLSNNMISGATDGAIRAMDGSGQRRRPRAGARRQRRQAAVDRRQPVACSSAQSLGSASASSNSCRGAHGAHLGPAPRLDGAHGISPRAAG